jgi:hypothetical protein
VTTLHDFDAFRCVLAGEFAATVDLGTHERDHRSVGRPEGLGDTCTDVCPTVSSRSVSLYQYGP